MTRAQFPARARDFSCSYCIQTSSGAHPAFYPVGSGISFPGGKADGQDADLSSSCSSKVKNKWSYTSTPLLIIMAWYLISTRHNCTFFLYLTIKTYGGVVTETSCIHNLSTRRRGVVDFMLRPLYPRKRSP
jgi:hypothetical protein